MFGRKIMLLPILIVVLCTSCGKEFAYYETSGEVFKTSFHIKYNYSRLLNEEIEEYLSMVNMSLNPFNMESVIYKVNNNIPVEVDDMFIEVFNKAMEVSEIFGGTYDITSAPLINLWGFGFSKMDSVSKEVIDSLKEFVGYSKVHLDGRKIVKEDQRLQINASSIAKGYACDVVARMFDSLGISDYMVEIGGEINAKGKNNKGVCWRIEIPKPFDNRKGQVNERMEVVELCNRSIATSGNYRNYYIRNGKKYAHTINPLTGYPFQSNILSASVIAGDCMTADAFATAFMTMDLDKALDIARQIKGLGFIFIYSDEDGNLCEVKSI